MWAVVFLLGPWVYAYASDSPQVVASAHHYATTLFPFITAFWLVNMLSSVLRGCGDMVRPAIVAATLLGSYLVLASILIPDGDSSVLAAVRGAAYAMAAAYLIAMTLVIYFIWHPSQPVRFRLAAFRSGLLSVFLIFLLREVALAQDTRGMEVIKVAVIG